MGYHDGLFPDEELCKRNWNRQLFPGLTPPKKPVKSHSRPIAIALAPNNPAGSPANIPASESMPRIVDREAVAEPKSVDISCADREKLTIYFEIGPQDRLLNS